MSTLLLGLALSLGAPPETPPPPPPPPPAVVVPVPPAHPNFVTPGPYVPYLYPVVPQPVVIAHPDWYPYPGPGYWYANNISPYHPVHHKVLVVPLPPPKVPAPPKKIPVPKPKEVEKKKQ